MNKFLKITMLAAIPLWGLTSCLDDNKYAYFHPNESWGTIVGTPENFKIETDNGNTLRVTGEPRPVFPRGRQSTGSRYVHAARTDGRE